MSDDGNNREDEEQHTEEISRQGQNYLQHMNTISSAITRRFHDLQNNPRHANVLGEELSRSFLFNVRRSAQNQRDRSGRSARRSSAADLRISSSFKAQITCLQDPCVTRINTNLHLDSLTSVGLGVPITERSQSHLGRSRQTTSMPTDWNANQMREFLFSIFIPLRGYSYKLCFSSVGGNLEDIPSDCDTPKKLKTFFSSFRRTAGKVFIRPDRYITTTPQTSENTSSSSLPSTSSSLPSTSSSLPSTSSSLPSTSSSLPSTSSSSPSTSSSLPSTSGFVPTDERNQPVRERSDNSTSTSGIARFIPTPGRNQPETDEDGMAILIRPGERSRRQAAQIARNNIRGWCSNRGSSLENENVQRNDSNTTSSIDSIISGSSIDNLGLSVTELRSQQNEQYLQSLMADQKKEQDKKDEEERLQNYHLRQQSLVTEIQKLRNMRKESLPSEPDEGFVLKLRSGEKRRFRQSDFVQVLIDFVGCQQNATKDFEISIAGISRKINSWSSSGMLEDFGIQHSAVLEVEYDIEKPCTNINSLVHRSYNELMSSLESQDERESSEEEPMENDVPPPVRESCDIRDTILEWKLELIDLDNFQTIKVSRRPESLWEHSLRCFRRSSFDVTKLLKVEFRNESGQDEGGLRREFLEILFRQMLCSSLLKDTGDGYEVTSNMMGMVNGHFHTFGKMLGTILIQGGPVSPAFSHMMVNYGLKGLDSATIDSVEDVNCKQIISRIQDADNPGENISWKMNQ
ncbi:uncharacterized protein LOC143063580 isoform X2 [Mytilus galloprovincialis]|uniref:uncharacterized protein LOC143063580 isoform X2 n=1 Tax=Mytilus galloprovincialis TaxID=29158 RepID=UPI003F7C5511